MNKSFLLACIAATAVAVTDKDAFIAQKNLQMSQIKAIPQQIMKHNFAQLSASLFDDSTAATDGEEITDVVVDCPHADSNTEGHRGKKDGGKNAHRNAQTSAVQEGILAQLRAAASPTCSTSADRAKADNEDFYALYSGSSTYTDSDFTADSSSLYWAGFGETRGQMAQTESYVTWARAGEKFSSNTLFGSNGITEEDIIQGYIGNCWFLAAASAVAEVPGRLEKNFLNNVNELSPNGIYGVTMYALGIPHTVIVDDWLPLQRYSNGTFVTLFASISGDGGIWGPILEKAFAKYHGNYEHIVGGDPRMAVRTLTGFPHYIVNHDSSLNKEELWTKLQDHVAHPTDIITSGTPNSAGGDSDSNADGLVMSHAYSLIGSATLSDGTRLVQMRNPHGQEGFKGKWSDGSSLWTAQAKADVEADPHVTKHEVDNDGIFFMSFDDYTTQFSETWFNYATDGMGSASFLKLNDNTNSPGSYDWCGAKCTRHELTLTSEVAQTIYLTAHTWDDRGMPDKQCTSENFDHSLGVPG